MTERLGTVALALFLTRKAVFALERAAAGSPLPQMIRYEQKESP